MGSRPAATSVGRPTPPTGAGQLFAAFATRSPRLPMLVGMEYELFEGCDGAACAGSDLTARLLADLAVASQALAIAEARFRAEAATGTRIGLRTRHARQSWKRQVACLRQMLDGMPHTTETSHVVSA
jgi:hypothetical protein